MGQDDAAGAAQDNQRNNFHDRLQNETPFVRAQCGPDELKTDDDKKGWIEKQDWYQADGSEYCKCFERYEPKEIGRQRYIESIIEKREPSPAT